MVRKTFISSNAVFIYADMILHLWALGLAGKAYNYSISAAASGWEYTKYD